MKILSVGLVTAVSAVKPRLRNELDDAMIVSEKSDKILPRKSYEERMVGILDNCGFFDDT